MAAYSTTQESGYYSGDTFTPNQKIVLPSVAEIGNFYNTGTWGIAYTTGPYPDGQRGFKRRQRLQYSRYCRVGIGAGGGVWSEETQKIELLQALTPAMGWER
jgi:hypothetical protein